MKFLPKLMLAAFLTLVASPVFAATKPVPQCLVIQAINGQVPCTGVVAVDSATGDPIRWQDLFPSGNGLPATSTPLMGSVTASGVTTTSGAANFSSGTVYIGPLSPQLARDIRVVLKGTWSGSFYVGTAAAAEGCGAGTINPLTVAGLAWATFTGNANETVDTPTLGKVGATPAPVYCAVATVSSGTLQYIVRQ